jgi:lipoprotein-anchoring transpeptidase ErfK/SrfK
MNSIVQIKINLARQTLDFLSPNFNKTYTVSTALNGHGQFEGSNCTPLGRHIVKAKIGHRVDPKTVFVGRKPEPELYSADSAAKHPDKDWILARILWLSGCEPGYNRLGDVDTMRRYIYIHGTPESEPMGVPKSHGCIRMRTNDVIELFDRTPLYTQVLINED